MDATVADDRILAVVNLVLQAVDQRLGPVREQLAELTNSMQRSQADLHDRIDECHRICVTVQAAGQSAVQTACTNEHTAGDEPTAQATAQLVEAANVLTDQVAFLEARVNAYTNGRIAELKLLIDRAGWTSGPVTVTSSKSALLGSAASAPPATSASIASALIATAPGITAPAHTPVAALAASANDIDNIAPAAARLAPLSRAGTGATSPTFAGEHKFVAAVHPLSVTAPASPIATAPAAVAVPPQIDPAPAPAMELSDDIARLSAQMSARLAAAVDRALGVLPAT